MSPSVLLNEINKLPVEERLLIVEKTLKAIRQKKKRDLAQAVTALYNDYKSDSELAIFTHLDTAPFYEPR